MKKMREQAADSAEEANAEVGSQGRKARTLVIMEGSWLDRNGGGQSREGEAEDWRRDVRRLQMRLWRWLWIEAFAT